MLPSKLTFQSCSCGTLLLLLAAGALFAGETVQLSPVAIYNDGRVLPPTHENPADLAISPDGRFVFASLNTTVATLYAYSRDKETGKLELRAKLSEPTVIAPRILGISPDSSIAFVTGAANLPFLFAVNGQAGALTEHQRIQNLKNGVVGVQDIQAACVSPDGKSLYLAGHRPKSLVCFRMDPATRTATFEECLQSAKAGQAEPGTSIVLTKPIKEARRVDGIGAIHTIACSPDGNHVLVASNSAGKALTVFARDRENGRLVQVQTLEDPQPVTNNVLSLSAIAFHPAGTHVVVSNRIGGISLLQRDSETGELTFVEAYVDEGMLLEPRPKVHMTEGLRSSTDVVWTRDGRAVFVASAGDNAIVCFRFDQEANCLKPIGRIRPENGIEGLWEVHKLAISPDCRFLYAGSRYSTVAAFEIKVTKD
ncbi:MAG: lactonase family protein [Planctomycetaceae bacterium]|nr:lactonase family protein [Planctomycetaceae bacterium]